MVETILQHWIFTRFAFPFLLVFFIVFAILEKTKIFGEGKKQINALVSFIIGLIFIGVAYTTEVVTNMVLFLTVALITMFIAMLIWGFIAGEAKIEGKPVKIIFGVALAIAVIIALLWSTGYYDNMYTWLFKQDWSGTFWTNLLFIAAIIGAVVFAMKGSSGGKS